MSSEGDTGAGAARSIRDFVRTELGCACPPEAFQQVEVGPAPAALAGPGRRHLVAIGGRLLLLVVEVESLQHVASEVAALLEGGRSLREAHGYNRFRLVLAVPGVETDARRQPGDNEPDKAFEVDLPDDRTYLHIVPSERLPDLEARPGSEG